MLAMRRLIPPSVLFVLAGVSIGCAPQAASPTSAPTPLSAEAATSAYMESVRSDPARLLLFLREMPKGGDLHNHLGGSIYAESLIKWAGEDGLCLSRPTMSLKEAPCVARRDEIAAAEIPRDPTLNTQVIDAWSMRNWNPAKKSGHDQFFDSFEKFDLATRRHQGDMLAEAVQRAAEQNVSYMELMTAPDDGGFVNLGMSTGFDTDFARLRDRLVARGLRDTVAVAKTHLNQSESKQKKLMRCELVPAPSGCRVVVRYLYQVLRGLPPQAVFAQILGGFEMATADSRVVGFNLVMPEDYPVPMNDFLLHMRMIDYLHSVYPAVKISLHAGELSEGLVPPEGMRFHIRESVVRGHARRIGHGTSILNEADAPSLLREMAEKRVMVEVALSSADAILGIKGGKHPLRTYLSYGVPVALATDDEGVLRTNITTDYRKAVEEQLLDYKTLKALARNSIVYAFVEDDIKGRLISQLEREFTSFEEQYAKRPQH
jgi:adenosine deaminase